MKVGGVTTHITYVPKGEPGKDGTDGYNGAVPRGPRKWSGISGWVYPGAAGDPYIDYVSHDGNLWICCQKHVVSSSYPPTTGSAHWQLATEELFVATMLMLAKAAVIENLIAEGIVMKDSSGNVVFEAHDGYVRALDGEFRGHVIAGNPNGMHVELDPSAPAMKVYNSSGQECTSHTGETFSTYSSLLPTGSGSGPSYVSSISGIYVDAVNARVLNTQSRNLFNSQFVPSGNGQMSFNVTTTFAVTATAGTSVIQCAAAKVIVDIYNSAGSLVGSKTTMLGSMGNGITSKTYTQKVSVNVQSGYKYMARLVVEAQGVNAQATAISTSARSFLTEFFQSKFFGNGFALSQNTDNYLIAMIENNIMRMRLTGEFWYNKVKQPYTLFAAQYVGGTMRILTAPPGFQASDFGSQDFVYQSGTLAWHKNATGQWYFGLGGGYDKNKVFVNVSATTNDFVATPSFIGYAASGVLAVCINIFNSAGTMADSSFFVEIKSV